jgi:hypothetical protein
MTSNEPIPVTGPLRRADGAERVTGRPVMGVREFVALHADVFGGRRP